jgi:hypothetical protein
MKLVRVTLLGAALLTLSSCWLLILPFIFGGGGGTNTPSEVVDFNTDPRILRGAWTATLTDANGTTSSAAFEFTPAYDSEDQYKVSGTVILEAVTYTVSGVFVGSVDAQFVQPQTSLLPPAGAQLVLSDSSGKTVFDVYLSRNAPSTSTRFTLPYIGSLYRTDTSSHAYGVSLNRNP